MDSGFESLKVRRVGSNSVCVGIGALSWLLLWKCTLLKMLHKSENKCKMFHLWKVFITQTLLLLICSRKAIRCLVKHSVNVHHF